MITFYLVLIIVTLLVVVALQHRTITRQSNLLIAWDSYADQCEAMLSDYDPTSDVRLNARLERVKAIRIPNAESVKVDLYGDEIPEVSIAMLPGFDAPSRSYKLGYDNDGSPIFTKREWKVNKTKESEPVNPVQTEDSKTEDKSKSNGNKQESTNGHKNGNKPSNNDAGLFEESSDYWKLVEMITKDRKIKNGKLPQDQFDWLKSKYAEWQNGKNPQPLSEYKQRFDNRYAK